MAQSIHSLSAYGRAFDVVLIVAGLSAAAAAIVAACSGVLRRRRDVRNGMRELERYLGRPQRTPGRPGGWA